MKQKLFGTIFVILALFLTILILSNKSLAYGISQEISGSKGSRTIVYLDSETDSPISWNDANKYFGIPMYQKMQSNGEMVYFFKGNEIAEPTYIRGSSSEDADNRASLYGKNAYRVHNTSEFKHAFDDIYNNLKIGEFHIIFSNQEDIDFNEVFNYYNFIYGVTDIKQNYYTYQNKGMWEPNHFGFNVQEIIQNQELILTTENIRLSGNEKVVVEDFINKALPYLYQNGSEYEKILAAYTYLTKTATYLTDNGFINDMLASNTSVYDSFINRKTTCIGYSIAFSYLMDKFGIESYIVDNVTAADAATHTFSSVHTYNIVKFNNVFYKVDLTGNVFLGGLNGNELYDNTKNISRTGYNGNGSVNIDFNAINSILNNSKNIKTTTTATIRATTTTKTYPYTLPAGYVKTSKKDNNTKTSYETTTIGEYPFKTTIITSRDSEGNIVEIPIEITDKIDEDDPNSNKENITSKNNNSKKGFQFKKINLNYILIPLAILLVIGLVVIKIFRPKRVKVNLNELGDIQKKEDE